MMYDLTLRTAGFLAGGFLLLIALPAVILPKATVNFAKSFPRSGVLGFALLTIAFLWSFYLLWTMEMGEFSSFRRPLLIALPIGFVLVLWFVNEFLAVRALGILALLAAEPLLEAAFLRHEPSRLLVTVFAYILIVKGLFWVTMPYLLRDKIDWAARSVGRWVSVNALAAVYGAVLLFFAFTRY
jgi:vacuolar-type H+-ATPase subunit I/STV1